ncbi:MAG: HIT family protein [Desulfomonilaceae bacterium]
MRKDDSCIFCKIVEGFIPCIKVYEDDRLLAFMDINPLNTGHTLVIPKEHFENIFEIPAEDYGSLSSVASKIASAIKKALNPDGINIMQLNGKAANQVVPHLHMHITPRWHGDNLTISSWEPKPGDVESIKENAQAIIAQL